MVPRASRSASPLAAPGILRKISKSRSQFRRIRDSASRSRGLELTRDQPEISRAGSEDHRLPSCRRFDRRLPLGVGRQGLAHEHDFTQREQTRELAGRIVRSASISPRRSA